ncbi:MAG: GNAT family N-acetyltransferase [Armatimonadetes bacterium]|nr:GNAT family N-acetyltransferase [Armatimonadota bacterium]
MTDIVAASTAGEFAAARRLIVAYQQWLGLDLEFQGFARELETLAEVYGPPGGTMLLARHDGEWVGCAGVRALAPGVAELKRLFVLPEQQGLGLGRALVEAAISAARELGYGALRLDTLERLDRANRLYAGLGFRRIEPYRSNPAPDAVFMALQLA